jgi:hypothetical protein
MPSSPLKPTLIDALDRCLELWTPSLVHRSSDDVYQHLGRSASLLLLFLIQSPTRGEGCFSSCRAVGPLEPTRLAVDLLISVLMQS